MNTSIPNLIKRKLRNYIIHKPLVIVLLLLLPMGCMLTREKYFHYSILSKIPENYVIEIEYQEHSDAHKQSDWKEQTKNKALIAAKFALQKHDISCNRFFVSDIISTMHDGVYVSVYAGNWGDGYSNYDEIRHEMIKVYEKRKMKK